MFSVKHVKLAMLNKVIVCRQETQRQFLGPVPKIRHTWYMFQYLTFRPSYSKVNAHLEATSVIVIHLVPTT